MTHKASRGLRETADLWQLALSFTKDCTSLNLEVVKKVEGYIRSRNLEGVCSLFQEAQKYHGDLDLFNLLRQVACLFRKNEQFANSELCDRKAKESLLQTERHCAATNRRLSFYYENYSKLLATAEGKLLAEELEFMRADISSLLGDFHKFSGSIENRIRVTSGATEDRSRRRALPFLKITGRIKCSPYGVKWLKSLLPKFGISNTDVKFKPIVTALIDFVPKNFKTSRIITKSATHDVPMQLAIDAYWKELLLKWGVDLKHGQSYNAELARRGSIDGSFATIDLQNASNTVSYGVVAFLLPHEWLVFLEAFRATHIRFKDVATGPVMKLEMFSSMGNGYTFVLETLLFAAACRAVGSKTYAVYGDDIVIETAKVDRLRSLLRFLGFQVNWEKSFVDPAVFFRESCGKDWLHGKLVTPFYVKRAITTNVDMSHLINGVVGRSLPGGGVWHFCRTSLKKRRLPLVPFNEDSRSGVHITPHDCYRRKILRVACATRGSELNWVPVFKGYVLRPTVRLTTGWRSYFLWFLTRGDVTDLSVRHSEDPYQGLHNGSFQQRTAALGRTVDVLPSGCTSTFTQISYAIRLRFYVPVLTQVPSHLYEWDDFLVSVFHRH